MLSAGRSSSAAVEIAAAIARETSDVFTVAGSRAVQHLGHRFDHVVGVVAPCHRAAECIDSIGLPTSTVAIPRRIAAIGPIVEPHARLVRCE